MKTNRILPTHTAPLAQLIETEYRKLDQAFDLVPKNHIFSKVLTMSHRTINVMDLIAYQIGWGNLVIYWYQTGLEKQEFPMPGEGFTTWDYTGLAHHFSKKYTFTSIEQAQSALFETVSTLLKIVETTHSAGTLDALGVWPWCTLASGKQWPLSKWIKVNTASPYKAARTLIRGTFKNKLN